VSHQLVETRALEEGHPLEHLYREQLGVERLDLLAAWWRPAAARAGRRRR
jgi:hypothetical protein